MNCKCQKVIDYCACPNTSCPNYGKCCECVIKHRNTDSLPYCLFIDNDGDKSVYNYYKKLKARFEIPIPEKYKDLKVLTLNPQYRELYNFTNFLLLQTKSDWGDILYQVVAIDEKGIQSEPLWIEATRFGFEKYA